MAAPRMLAPSMVWSVAGTGEDKASTGWSSPALSVIDPGQPWGPDATAAGRDWLQRLAAREEDEDVPVRPPVVFTHLLLRRN